MKKVTCWTECYKCDYHIVKQKEGYNACEENPQKGLFVDKQREAK